MTTDNGMPPETFDAPGCSPELSDALPWGEKMTQQNDVVTGKWPTPPETFDRDHPDHPNNRTQKDVILALDDLCAAFVEQNVPPPIELVVPKAAYEYIRSIITPRLLLATMQFESDIRVNGVLIRPADK
jgi:hypothetical protein